MARITFLLPVYNAEKFLRECLEGILSQSISEFGVIACNDGSKDSSLEILREYAARDNRITVLDNQKNLGIVKSRNRLLKALPPETEFVAWIDADDVCLPHRLERQMEFLEAHQNIGGVGSSLEIIDENSLTTGFRSYPCDADEISKKLPRSNILAQPAMLLRRSVIEKTGEYSANCPVCQDYEYWLRALDHCNFANLPEPVIRYRISTQQVKQSKLKLSLSITLRIQRDYYKRNGKRMPFAGMMKQLAGFMLMLLPSQWILQLFCVLTYKKQGNS